ncbi:MAG: helix-turn-helix domain-containing protein [Sphaerochaetaceae bacterium]
MYSLVIVDDEEELLNGLSRNFPWEKLGFFVAGSFSNARDALGFFNTSSSDVLLTDIRLPFMSGLQLIDTVSHLPDNKTLFCVISAYNDFSYAQEAIRQGVKYYLLKPASFSEIEKAFNLIKKTLDHSSLSVCPSTDVALTNNPLVDETLSLMNKYMDTCSLQSIATSLGINDSYLSRLFKEKTGKNFQEYFLKLKMRKAADLLKSPANLSNNEIAHMLGYNDVQNFCRSFKKEFNATPKEFRKKAVASCC